MTAMSKAVNLINTLSNCSAKLSELLADTDTSDVPGRDLRLIDLSIGTAVQSIKIGLRCNATEERISKDAEQLAAIALRNLHDLQRWLAGHPAYVSQTSDGRARAGKLVAGKVILAAAEEVDRLLSTIAPNRIRRSDHV